MRRLLSASFLLALAAALTVTLFGCGHKLTGSRVANQPPHTLLWVQGPVDTVNHLVHMYWYGTDQDGYVVGYQYKLVNPADTAAADSQWVTTTRSDTVFSIKTPAGFARPTLYVRAIDNVGQLDPNPAVETFMFRNKAPVLGWRVFPSRLSRSDTTFASVSVSWNCSDPDGDLTLVKYRLWLSSNPSQSDVIQADQAYTVLSARFKTDGVHYYEGPETLFVQAIDDGGMSSNIIQTSWYVRQPVPSPDYASASGRPGRLLIIDDVPTTNTAQNWVDSVYTLTAARNLPVGSWTVLRPEINSPLKTSADVAQTLSLYDAVVWYKASGDSVSALARNFESGFWTYLDGGGSLYLEGLYLFDGPNAPGSFSANFVTRYLDAYGLFAWPRPTNADSCAAWGWFTSRIYTPSLDDSLRVPTQPVYPFYIPAEGGTRILNVKKASDVLFLGRRGNSVSLAGFGPATTDATPGVQMPVVTRSTTPAGGKVVVATVPIGIATPTTNGRTMPIMQKIFQELGIVH